MSDELPGDCPTRECPMESATFIQRIERIEEEIAESKRLRHERNSHISEIIGQVRADRRDDNERLDRIEKAVDKLVGAIEGTLGFSGIVKTQQDQGAAIASLKTWRTQATAFYMGAMAVFGIAFTGVNWLLNHWKN